MTHPLRLLGSLATVGVVAIALTAAPIGLGSDLTPDTKSAFAKGKGSGKSAGKRGGRGGKHGGASSASDSDQEFQKSRGQGRDDGAAHDSDSDDNEAGNHKYKDKNKNKLGNLNAAHASPTALANAAPNSMVGLLAAYAKAAEDMSEDEARAALGEISNKAAYDADLDADAVDDEVLAEVNALLGVENKPAPADEETSN